MTVTSSDFSGRWLGHLVSPRLLGITPLLYPVAPRHTSRLVILEAPKT